MPEITLNEWMQRATADAIRYQNTNNNFTMQLVQQTTGTLYPTTGAQAASGTNVTKIGTSQVRATFNELFTSNGNWGTIDRVQLGFDGDDTSDTWKIYLRDTSNTDNATTIALSASNWTLTIRYLYIEYIEAP